MTPGAGGGGVGGHGRSHDVELTGRLEQATAEGIAARASGTAVPSIAPIANDAANK